MDAQRIQTEMRAQAKRDRDDTRREFASVRQEIAGYHATVMGMAS